MSSVRELNASDTKLWATELPNITDADLKKPAQFKLIGRKDIGRLDVPSKVNGTAKYGIDVQIPDMVYASVLEAPVEGAKVEVLNIGDVTKIKGVTKVLPLPFGVAVIGDTVDFNRDTIQASDCSAKIFVKPRTKCLCDHRCPFFRRIDNVVEEICV